MKALKITIILSCLITAFTCSAAKYQIKVLNTPTITIDNREAKVGDWFNDQSVIVWSRDNQAMRVVSDENKVYTLSAKLYKEAKAKKFSDFILYTKPLAARGTKDLDLIEQLTERFDQDLIMLDEIVIDLSDIELPHNTTFRLYSSNNSKSKYIEITPYKKQIIILRSALLQLTDKETIDNSIIVELSCASQQFEFISESFEISIFPTSVE